MLTTILVIGAVLLALIAGVLAVASRRPSEFHVERSTLIGAPAERIFPLIADLRAMNRWNPFNEDPSIKGTYSEPARGVGARYGFESRRAGSGYTEVVEEHAPSDVGIRLVMSKPFACDNRVQFRLEPAGPATRVTWAMSGTGNLMSKCMGLFIDCDKMVGSQFDKGLAKLKSIAEGQDAPQGVRVV